MTASNMGNGPDKNFSNAKVDRKMRKPLIEKKRRERINCSLEQLKGIMVDAYNLDQSKLEKADVLEITVQHMEGLQKGHGTGSLGLSSVDGFESRQRYSSGYIQCMHEVHNLLLSCPGMDKTLGARLLNHLLKSLPNVSSDISDTGGVEDAVDDPDSPSHSNSVGVNSIACVGNLRNNGSLNGATNDNVVSSGIGGFGGLVVSNGSHGEGCDSSDSSVGGGGRGNSHSGSPPPGPASSSPPTSPLSLPGRTPFKPRRLLLHAPASPPQAAAPYPPGPVVQLPCAPQVSPSVREASGVGDGSRLRERPSAASSSSLLLSSPLSSAVGQAGTAALSTAFPSAEDPSMWRPW